MDHTSRLAVATADAADAWLKDPLDGNVYQRLVEATLRWRAHSQPQLQPPTQTTNPSWNRQTTSSPSPCRERWPTESAT